MGRGQSARPSTLGSVRNCDRSSRASRSWCSRISITEHSIFDRFERASSVRNHPGLGLGLFVAREIVVAHGGSIQVSAHMTKPIPLRELIDVVRRCCPG
ncbi:MAG: sensor histidine kinase [Deltaproteobacteria bacterium]